MSTASASARQYNQEVQKSQGQRTASRTCDQLATYSPKQHGLNLRHSTSAMTTVTRTVLASSVHNQSVRKYTEDTCKKWSAPNCQSKPKELLYSCVPRHRTRSHAWCPTTHLGKSETTLLQASASATTVPRETQRDAGTRGKRTRSRHNRTMCDEERQPKWDTWAKHHTRAVQWRTCVLRTVKVSAEVNVYMFDGAAHGNDQRARGRRRCKLRIRVPAPLPAQRLSRLRTSLLQHGQTSAHGGWPKGAPTRGAY